MQVSYHIRACLRCCVDLQQQYDRWGKELALAELMRMAVTEDPSAATVLALCRILFVSNRDEPLRPPGLGDPWFLGDTSAEDWPLEPIHWYHDVPFFIVRGWSLAGLPERPSCYLAYSLLSGAWNKNRCNTAEQEELAATAQEFIHQGPWKRPLAASEQQFLLSQITPAASHLAADLPGCETGVGNR